MSQQHADHNASAMSLPYFEGKQFIMPVRIYYEDTDAGGIVYNGNYLKFFERARTEWLRHLGLTQAILREERHILFVVVAADLAYRAPARLDDVVLIKSRLTHIGNSSFTFDQRGERNGQLLVESTIRLCCVSLDPFKPTPVPEDIRQLFLAVQDD